MTGSQDAVADAWTDVAGAALLKAMFQAADVMAGVFELLDGDYRYVIANAATAAFYGLPPDGLNGRKGRELGLTEAQVRLRLATLRRCWDTGRTLTREYQFGLPGGRPGWFLGTFSPIPGPTPRVSFVLIDVTARHEAQRDAERQGARLQLALSAAGLGLWEFDLQRDVISWDQRTRELFGVEADAPIDYAAYAARLLEDERPMMRAAYEGAIRGENGGRYVTEHRTTARDGTQRWVRGSGQVLFGQDGVASHVLGTVQDITEEVQARDRQALMMAELNHRVKNNLATVQSMAAQTARHATDLKAFTEDFEGRLVALARTHDVLTHNAWVGAELSVLVARELEAFRGRVRTSGPEVRLTAGQALAVGLMLHELATNAAKYGALTTTDGRIDVAWSLVRGELALTWTESGGPLVSPPVHAGFGTRLIGGLTRSDLQGRTETVWRPEGLQFELRAPLG
ncbi:sensor histidine kinase [Phenylobacterium sp.]|uniref:sensor histidine kinase n=1 Tax=Phenylobacterium sp. TaxID=1871053 RepID=UPI002C53F88B|nr:HWE histidine kinase domain-containing protein [Phenylobacterium sp.]HVI33811.1 HWE histidine kinase domain-containing protein [Phenylobacterium sp.]